MILWRSSAVRMSLITNIMMGDCLSCSVTNLSLANFGEPNCQSSDSDVSDYVEGINIHVKYHEWRRDDDSYLKKH